MAELERRRPYSLAPKQVLSGSVKSRTEQRISRAAVAVDAGMAGVMEHNWMGGWEEVEMASLWGQFGTGLQIPVVAEAEARHGAVGVEGVAPVS